MSEHLKMHRYGSEKRAATTPYPVKSHKVGSGEDSVRKPYHYLMEITQGKLFNLNKHDGIVIDQESCFT